MNYNISSAYPLSAAMIQSEIHGRIHMKRGSFVDLNNNQYAIVYIDELRSKSLTK